MNLSLCMYIRYKVAHRTEEDVGSLGNRVIRGCEGSHVDAGN